MRICLIIEDNLVSQLFAQNLAKKLNYQSVVCENGREALEYCNANAMPELILLDGYMPEMDGLDFLRALKKLPGSDAPLIIFCSTSMDRDDVMEALRIGAHYHMPKPINQIQLLDVLQERNIA